jgi:hypothetical protein
VVLWVQTPSAFVSRFEGFFLPDPSDLLALLGLDLYRGEPLAFPSVGLLGLLAPILILALGNLLLNLDRLPGWALFTWTLSAVALGSALAPQPQFWPAFLPLLPALALTLAFALDRLRAALLTTVGSWLGQATTYLALGLVIWVALLGWVADQEFLQANGDPVTATGLLLHSLPPNRTAVLVLGQRRESVNPQTPVLQLLGQPALATHQTLLPESWPATLPQQSSVVIQPEDQALVDEVQSRYPGGQLVIQRDRRGNPLLFIYRLP